MPASISCSMDLPSFGWPVAGAVDKFDDTNSRRPRDESQPESNSCVTFQDHAMQYYNSQVLQPPLITGPATRYSAPPPLMDYYSNIDLLDWSQSLLPYFQQQDQQLRGSIDQTSYQMINIPYDDQLIKNMNRDLLPDQEITSPSHLCLPQSPLRGLLDNYDRPASYGTQTQYQEQFSQKSSQTSSKASMANHQVEISGSGSDSGKPAGAVSSFYRSARPTQPIQNEISNVKTGEPAIKKPRLTAPSPFPTFKVRKEKLGDRITALQQLVSPFGKTDTASVLQEATDYIKFLHDQIQGFSAPYLKNGHQVQQCFTRSNDAENLAKQDLRSRGLCVVPISSTFGIASEAPVDFWASMFGGRYC